MIAVRRVPSLQTIARRLDAIAIQQLRDECARLAREVDRLDAENEQLRKEAYWADQAAESWRDDALRLQEDLCTLTGGKPGITVDGALVVAEGGAS